MTAKLLDRLHELKSLAEHLDLPLGHKEQPVPPDSVAKKTFEDSTEVPLPSDVTLQLKAKASGQVDLFQGGKRAPKDPDGILAATQPKSDSETPPPPVLSNEGENKAWLKVSLQGDLSADSTIAPGGNGSLTFKASQTLRFCDYRLHFKTDTLRAALEADFGTPRLALSLKDIRNLQPGEALSMSRKGSLAATVKLSWSEVFAAAPAWLASIIAQGGGIGVKVDAGLTLTASVSVDDDFRVFFARRESGELCLALSKAETTKTAAGFKVGISAKVNIPDGDFDKLLSGLFGDGGASLAKDAREALKKKLEELAETKIEAGFTYEYNRISTDKVLLQGTMDFPSLDPPLHHAALEGDAEALLKHTSEYATIQKIQAVPPLLKLEQYLQQETYKEARSWGFSMGIGKWKIFKALDKVEFEREVSRDIQGHEKVAYKGGWTYEDGGRKWATDYKAEMAAFSTEEPPGVPHVSEFQWGFHISRTYSEKMDRDLQGELRDWALLWKVVEPSLANRLAADLADLKGIKVEAAFQILIHHEEVLALLSHAGDWTDISSALAASMPWHADYPQRATGEIRRDVYLPVWTWYLGMTSGSQPTPEKRDHLLKYFDDTKPSLSAFNDLAGSIDRNAPSGSPTTIRGRWKAFIRGFKGLAPSKAFHDPAIPDALKDMIGMGSQHFLARTLGVYLLDLAEKAKVGSKITRSLVVKPLNPEDKTKKILVYGNGGKTEKDKKEG